MNACVNDNPVKNMNSSSTGENASSIPSRGVKRSLEDETANYPKELRAMFGPLKCDLCQVTANSTLSAFTHYKGKVHQKKVNKYLKDNNLDLESNKKAKTQFVATSCEICDVELTSELQSLQHFSGKSHKKKMANSDCKPKIPVKSEKYDPSGRFGIGKSFQKQTTPPPADNEPEAMDTTPSSKDAVHFCSVCSVFTTGSEALTAHMTGSKHKKKLVQEKATELNSLNKFRTPSGYFYCALCDAYSNSADQFLIHMKSKKHINKKKSTT